MQASHRPADQAAKRIPSGPRFQRLSKMVGGLAVFGAFGLGVFAAQLTAPQPALALLQRPESGFYLPVSSRQLTVLIQPLEPSEAVLARAPVPRSSSQARAARLLSREGLMATAEDLEQLYPFTFLVAEATLTIPDDCFDAERRQYDTSALLDWLKSQVAPEHFRTIGVLDEDVFDEDYNFLFGQARLAGPVCVASAARLSLPDGNPRRWHHIVRHELGHTLGLHHVPDQTSVMAFGNSTEEVDKQGSELTAADWARLREIHPIRWER